MRTALAIFPKWQRWPTFQVGQYAVLEKRPTKPFWKNGQLDFGKMAN
jgi:hypothetical protein